MNYLNIMTIDQIIGKNLKFLRENFHYTQDDICKMLGISQPAYHKYETGETMVNRENLEKLAKLYFVDEYDIMQEDDSQLIPALAYAFRGQGDPSAIPDFHKIVKNYIQMCNELSKKNRD